MKRAASSFMILCASLALLQATPTLASTSADTLPEPGGIAGIVRAQMDNSLLDNVTVLLYKDSVVVDSTVTNEFGLFRFRSLDVALYNVKLKKFGYRDYTVPGVVVQGKQVASLRVGLVVPPKPVQPDTTRVTADPNDIEIDEVNELEEEVIELQSKMVLTESLSSYEVKSGRSRNRAKMRKSRAKFGGGSKKGKVSNAYNGSPAGAISTGTSTRGVRVAQQKRYHENGNVQQQKEFFYAPATFTPNGDGINDNWAPDIEGFYGEYNSPCETYAVIYENDFIYSDENPTSTFSIDVDNGSYTNSRRYLNGGSVPPADAVRIEEFVNYFNYNYPTPKDKKEPFAVSMEAAPCPWAPKHTLVSINLKGYELEKKELPPANLVFLIDVSGSMSSSNKLGYVKDGLNKLVDEMRPEDKVSLCVYAGAAGCVLDPTPGTEKQKIKDAINNLKSGGSTAGGAGIELAYKKAVEGFIKDGNNRVVLASDGDFNVGINNVEELKKFIAQKRETGVFFTTLGVGGGNYRDDVMEQLANNGNGYYFYLDSPKESDRVFTKGLTGNFFTIAKDVKIQVEFNPEKIKGYRLLGYENRLLNAEDFDNDKVDAGELGAGHTVTAMYELIPIDADDDLLAERGARQVHGNFEYKATTPDELMNLKLRYKLPDEDKSKLKVNPVSQMQVKGMNEDFKFAAAVASFGMLLRGSAYSGSYNYDDVVKLANQGIGADPHGDRAEFVGLVQKASGLTLTSQK